MLDFNAKTQVIVPKEDIKFVDFVQNQLILKSNRVIKFILVEDKGLMKFAYYKYLYPNL